MIAHFWCQVVQGAAKSVPLSIWTVCAPAEVRELDGTLAIQKILGLEVSMDHFLGM